MTRQRAVTACSLAALAQLALLLPPLASAQTAGFPHGGGGCDTDWDCSLGGVCDNFACVCDIHFTGEQCNFLNLARGSLNQGLQIPNYHSWGGRALEPVDGKYHGFFSWLCNHASLATWTTDSAIMRATSDRPEGPFTPAQLVMQPWSHNTVIVRNPPTDEMLIFHIGTGIVDPALWRPCFESDEPGAEALPVAEVLNGPPEPIAGQGEVLIESAPSVYGPWSRFNNNTGIFVDFNASWMQHIAGNPAPFIFDNGTVLLYFTAVNCPDNWNAMAPNCIGVARADSWRGPYTALFPKPLTSPESEDPFVWRDPRGNFHMLTNVNTDHYRCDSNVACGGHAWSRDGLVWSNLTIGAYGPLITLANGTVWNTSYVERPLVYAKPDGTPLVFYTGMGRGSYEDCASWAQRFCTPADTDCGPTVSRLLSDGYEHHPGHGRPFKLPQRSGSDG